MTFSGSYESRDVTFLLRPVQLAPTPVEEKERLIQSGRRHYSELIGTESPPDGEYLALFQAAFDRNAHRLASELVRLSRALAERPGRELVLVSLARAGTPIGVLLRRAAEMQGRRAVHYSISIIRDRGIDEVALDHILERHAASDLVFVDGWTGKGAIAEELERSVGRYARSRGVVLDASVVVLADLAGVARLAATSEDYLIPSSILNATVSGLISRTILNDACVGPGEFHACVHYEHLAPADLSRWFVDALTARIEALRTEPAAPLAWTEAHRAGLRSVSAAFMAETQSRWGISDPLRIKPGISESTRALLRRVPDRLILRDPDDADVRHLVHLARRREVAIQVEPAMPYRAATIIRATKGAE
ncbi:cysteine protease StiP family protein [Archangium gephyra]|uniref:cysteine protease StiP family protein n=1 Tax=Archangium gephyra TaxID=48 RepID=UPI0035D4506C